MTQNWPKRVTYSGRRARTELRQGRARTVREGARASEEQWRTMKVENEPFLG